jgi:hypothetical protein
MLLRLLRWNRSRGMKRFSLPDVDWRAYAVLAAGFFTAAIYALPDVHTSEGFLAVAIITICAGIYVGGSK